jgi:hypothetical protein
MSRFRLWRFTCDNCGKVEEFKSLYLPILGGWKHRKNGLDFSDFCSDKCYKEAQNAI